MKLPGNRRVLAASWIVCACVTACLVMTSASGASTGSALQSCASGRAPSYALKAGDKAFLAGFLSCLLNADGLKPYSAYYINSTRRFPPNLVNVCTSRVGKPKPKETEFPTEMASTVAGFASAPVSDNRFSYVNRTLAAKYTAFCGVSPRSAWYEFYGDTTPPSPTLAAIAKYVAATQASVKKTAKAWGHAPELAIDTVVQSGVWFHDGTGPNLRYAVLIYEGTGADPGAAP